jgi:hypothetical protein
MFAAALALLLAPVPDQRRADQMEATEARREGRILPLREIERRIVPTMPGAQYLGVEFDAGSGIYTLKFLRDGRVIWLDVDGRSGQVVGRMGR